mmetsp:Transcript_27560/g.75889  ORF Transcript_27560/g.75889 Transcript_27560/m.75889 type:complete len:859 (+) Transcript_27560:206-2782(+)
MPKSTTMSPSAIALLLWLTFCSTSNHVAAASSVNDTATSASSNGENSDASLSLYTAHDDASWAIVSTHLSSQLSSDKQSIYDNFIRECVEGSGEACRRHDMQRLDQNLRQPPAMLNYTTTGFKKIRAPPQLYALLKEFWDANREHAVNEWDEPTSFHNAWKVPTKMLHLENTKLQGGGKNLSAAVWDSARDVLEEWTGQKLAGSSVYGIRVYYNQSVLTPHVDRLPLVSSAIINVDQDVDEPWYLEVYGHDGKATNVSMAPGDMVLYESHSVIHGRPFPLNGKYYANVFCHFEVMGDLESAEELPTKSKLPPYVIEGSDWGKTHVKQFPQGWTLFSDLERLALQGDTYTLRVVAQKEPERVKKQLCKIVRLAIEHKHMDILKLLFEEMEMDANVLCTRRSNRPGTPLDLAEDLINDNGHDHAIAEFLFEKGAETAGALRARGVLDYYTAEDDASWAIVSDKLSRKLGAKQAMYDEFMRECDTDDSTECKDHDWYRRFQNRIQPSGMINYTSTGFAKIRAPQNLYSLIKDFWDKNRDNSEEEWDEATSFHNLWQVPTSMVQLDNPELEGGGMNLSAAIWDAGREILEEWTGQKLSGSSVYGIRIYHNQSILTPHVDRNPLICSAIINVDQDVDEPWYLEVYGHDGKATNVSMSPGDMVLYESHSVIHGRPFPMNGKFYANIFMHFEVMGDVSGDKLPESGDLPPYIVRGSGWEDQYRSEFPRGWRLFSDLVGLARRGDWYTLRVVAEKDIDRIDDAICPIIKAAVEDRQMLFIAFLFEDLDYDINMVCYNEEDDDEYSPLDFVFENPNYDDDDPIANYLIMNGAMRLDDLIEGGFLDDDGDDDDDDEGGNDAGEAREEL